jgi:hypothetical protein
MGTTLKQKAVISIEVVEESTASEKQCEVNTDILF